MSMELVEPTEGERRAMLDGPDDMTEYERGVEDAKKALRITPMYDGSIDKYRSLPEMHVKSLEHMLEIGKAIFENEMLDISPGEEVLKKVYCAMFSKRPK